ncbi:MAG: RHS repeat-associated core domain-containing protein, partial [Anaerolineae bacterium]
MADPDYLWIYDAENRLTGVSGAAAATFVYDGDGNRVKATFGSTTTIYVGNTYERDNGSTVRKYYYAGGVRIAMRSGGQTYYLLGDHLGGTNVTANGTNGAELGRVLYRPWGETRLSSGSTPTTWRFTGQREDATIGLYFYNARYLDPQLGRFISADSVVQGNAREPGVVLPLVVSYANPRVLAQMNDFQRGVGQAFAAFDPQLLNRYAYARNNPLAYRDDSGHVVWWVVGGIVGGVVGFGAYALTHQDNFNWKEAALWTGGGAVVGATFGAGAQFVAGALGTQ